MSSSKYSRASAADDANSRKVPHVVHATATPSTQKPPAPPFLKTDQQTPASDREIRSGTARLPANAYSKAGSIQSNQHALKFSKKGARRTGRKVGRPKCDESEWQILAEAAVDIAEILLGDGIHKINPLEDRVKVAIKKAESIRKVVNHGDYDRLSRELSTNSLPRITPGALLRWLDGEFKDVIDAVFFVDSAEEFARLLQTFAQGMAGNFFGDKVRVIVKVNGATREKKRHAPSDEGLTADGPDLGATLDAGPADVSAHSEGPVL